MLNSSKVVFDVVTNFCCPNVQKGIALGQQGHGNGPLAPRREP